MHEICLTSQVHAQALLWLQAVQALLGALPLKSDFDEAVPVYSTLCQIITDPGMAARLGPLGPRVLQVSASVCMPTVPCLLYGLA